MNHRVIKRVSTILLPLLAAGALAQDAAPEEEQAEVRRYAVEMIIFAYEQDVSTGSEVFMPDIPPPSEFDEEEELGVDVIDDAPERTELELISHERQEGLVEIDKRYAFIMLSEEDLVLQDVIEGLDNLDAYAPLMHFAWTQPTYPEEETELRPLSSFATPPDGLEGDISLYLSRYLHLSVNLQLDASALEKTDATEVLGEDEESEDLEDSPDRFYFGDGINEIGSDDMRDDSVVNYPVYYRIEEDRIFRNGELRYYDHPKFGVLAKITRVEEQEPDEFEEELLGFDGE